MRIKHASGFLELVEEVMPRVREISVEELLNSLPNRGRAGVGGEAHSARANLTPHPNLPPQGGKEFVLIDVREDNEWNAGFIPGAIHLGRGIIERDIEKTIPDKTTKLVLYCGGGYRSALACDSIQKMGYSNAWSLAGGWKAWYELISVR